MQRQVTNSSHFLSISAMYSLEREKQKTIRFSLKNFTTRQFMRELFFRVVIF